VKIRFLVPLCLTLFFINSEGFCVPPSKKDTKRILPVVALPASRIPRFKLNTQFGFNVLSDSAVVSGFQFGRLISSKSNLYLGPELSFMLFSPGSVLNVLLGGWLENSWFESSRKRIDIGVAIGAGFANKAFKLRTSNLVVLFDFSYSQQIDDSLSVRGQVRPGLINGVVFASVSFNAQFAFP